MTLCGCRVQLNAAQQQSYLLSPHCLHVHGSLMALKHEQGTQQHGLWLTDAHLCSRYAQTNTAALSARGQSRANRCVARFVLLDEPLRTVRIGCSPVLSRCYLVRHCHCGPCALRGCRHHRRLRSPLTGLARHVCVA